MHEILFVCFNTSICLFAGFLCLMTWVLSNPLHPRIVSVNCELAEIIKLEIMSMGFGSVLSFYTYLMGSNPHLKYLFLDRRLCGFDNQLKRVSQ